MGRHLKKKKKTRKVPREGIENTAADPPSDTDSEGNEKERQTIETPDNSINSLHTKKKQPQPSFKVDLEALLEKFAEDFEEKTLHSSTRRNQPKKKKKRRTDQQREKNSLVRYLSIPVLPRHAETQIDELVAIDAIYPHSVRVTKAGYLSSSDPQLKNIHFVRSNEDDEAEYELAMKEILKGTQLKFHAANESLEEGAIEYRIGLSSIMAHCDLMSSSGDAPARKSQKALSEQRFEGICRRHLTFDVKRSVRKLTANQASIAEITVIYPIRYPEVPPPLMICFSFNLSPETERHLNTSIDNVLLDFTGRERILPVCVAVSEVLSEREAIVREKDSALWEQMQQRDRKLQRSPLSGTLQEKHSIERIVWSTSSANNKSESRSESLTNEVGNGGEESSSGLYSNEDSEGYKKVSSAGARKRRKLQRKMRSNLRGKLSAEETVVKQKHKCNYSTTISDALCPEQHALETFTVGSASTGDETEMWPSDEVDHVKRQRNENDKEYSLSRRYRTVSWVHETSCESPVDRKPPPEKLKEQKHGEGNIGRSSWEDVENSETNERKRSLVSSSQPSDIFQGYLDMTWTLLDLQAPDKYAENKDLTDHSDSPQFQSAKSQRSKFRKQLRAKKKSSKQPLLDSDCHPQSWNATPTSPRSEVDSEILVELEPDKDASYSILEEPIEVNQVQAARVGRFKLSSTVDRNEPIVSLARRKLLNSSKRKHSLTIGNIVASSEDLEEEKQMTDTQVYVMKDSTKGLNRFRSSRYAKDFEELQLQPPSSHAGQIVSKVRHKIDLNIYAIKRIEWPQCPLVISNVASGSNGSDNPLPSTSPDGLPASMSLASASELQLPFTLKHTADLYPLRLPTVDSESFLSTLSSGSMRHSVGGSGSSIETVDNNFTSHVSSSSGVSREACLARVMEISDFVKSRFQAFSLALHQRIMLEISKLSRLQHTCIGRILQGWIQRTSLPSLKNKTTKQAIFFGILPTSANTFQLPIRNPCCSASQNKREHVESFPSLPVLKKSVGSPFPYGPEDFAAITYPGLPNSRTSSYNYEHPCSLRSLDDLVFPLYFVSSSNLETVSGDRVFCIQMEFCHSPTLRSWIDHGRLGPREVRHVWTLFRQLLEVLVIMHREGLQHRGLSPSNIFVEVDDQGTQTLKIGDFGLGNLINREAFCFYNRLNAEIQQQRSASFLLRSQNSVEASCSPEDNSYAWSDDKLHQRHEILVDESIVRSRSALESLKADHHEVVNSDQFNVSSEKKTVSPSRNSAMTPELVDERTDVYSLGIILFEMCHEPFRSLSQRIEAIRHLLSRYPPPSDILSGIPSQAAALVISQMIHPDPQRRPSAAHLLYREQLVPPAVGKTTFKQFLLRLSSPTTSESVRTMSILYARQLDSRTAASFYSNPFPSWNCAWKHQNMSVFLSRGPFSLLGNGFSHFYGSSVSAVFDKRQTASVVRDARRNKRKTSKKFMSQSKEGNPAPHSKINVQNKDGLIARTAYWNKVREILLGVSAGFFSSYFDWRTGANAKAYHIAVVRDAVWQLVEKSFLRYGATMIDLSQFRFDLVQCDCGAVVAEKSYIAQSFGGIDFAATASKYSEPMNDDTGFSSYAVSRRRPCWRSILQKRQRLWLTSQTSCLCPHHDSTLSSKEQDLQRCHRRVEKQAESEEIHQHSSGRSLEGKWKEDVVSETLQQSSSETMATKRVDEGLTFLPSVLLDMSGALTSLSSDLLTPLSLASAMYSLYQRPNISKGTGKLGSDIPPCTRQYCIKSVYTDGPFWMSEATFNRVDQPYLIDGQNLSNSDSITQIPFHPQSSLRAVFDVTVWLDLAFRDTSYDKSSIQLNILMLQAEHILSSVDAILPLASLLGPLNVSWTHTDFLVLLISDICDIADSQRLQLLDLLIRCYGCPKDIPTLIYILYLSPPTELLTAISSGSIDALALSSTEWDLLVAQLGFTFDLELIFKIWAVRAIVLQQILSATTVVLEKQKQTSGTKTLEGRLETKRSREECGGDDTKGICDWVARVPIDLFSSFPASLVPLTLDQLDLMINLGLEFISTSIDTFGNVGSAKATIPVKSLMSQSFGGGKGARPHQDLAQTPSATNQGKLWKPAVTHPQLLFATLNRKTRITNQITRHVDGLLHHLKLIEKTFSLSCNPSNNNDVQCIFDVKLNFDSCSFNSTDSLAFRIFIDNDFCIASGGRYDRLIDTRCQYITNTTPILQQNPKCTSMAAIAPSRDTTGLKGRSSNTMSQSLIPPSRFAVGGVYGAPVSRDLFSGISALSSVNKKFSDTSIEVPSINTFDEFAKRVAYAWKQINTFDKNFIKNTHSRKLRKENPNIGRQKPTLYGMAAVVAEFDLERVVEFLLLNEFKRSSDPVDSELLPKHNDTKALLKASQVSSSRTNIGATPNAGAKIRAESVPTTFDNSELKKKRRQSVQHDRRHHSRILALPQSSMKCLTHIELSKVTQKRRHQAAAFSLVESIVSNLQIRCSLRISPVFDLARLKERLRASGVLCLVVLVPGASQIAPVPYVAPLLRKAEGANDRVKLSPEVVIAPPMSTPKLQFDTIDHTNRTICPQKETVSYRVEFLNAVDVAGQAAQDGTSGQHRTSSKSGQTKSYVRLDCDVEVLQLIRNTFQRLSR